MTRKHEFRRGEDGGMTVFGMFLFLTTCAVGAIALDVTHLYSARTQLQVAADLAAHAAIYRREKESAVVARAAAISAMQYGMPAEVYGPALTDAEIVFGDYDFADGSFTPSATSRQAVQVTTQRLAARRNPVESFLFRTVGIDTWDVGAQATYAAYRPGCFREGLFADGMIDIQSNNGFHAGFCLHSNDYISFNQNNFFEPGTVVSMPNTADIDLPASGFEKNEGLQAALRSGAYRLRLIGQLPTLINELSAAISNPIPTYDATPSYITSTTPVSIAGIKKIDPTMMTAGRVHNVACNGATLTVEPGLYSRVALVTNCELRFSNGAVLEDAIFATRNTSATSVTATNGLRVGRLDNCAPGGGASIWTLGGMNFPSALEGHNAQFLAVGSIQFAANAIGMQGISMQAGGEIHGTSNMQMGLCGTGMEGIMEVDYFRLVR